VPIRDAEIKKKLCPEITESRQREIDEMNTILWRLDNRRQ